MPLVKAARPAVNQSALSMADDRDSLLAALRDPARPAGRRAAALDLAACGEVAVAPLAAALSTEPVAAVRAAILTALTMIGTEAAALSLGELVVRADTELRNAAIEALQQLGEEATSTIDHLLVAGDASLRISAMLILEGQGHPRGRAALRAALERDPEVNVGLAAVEVLAQIGQPDDRAALTAFAARFPDHPCVAFSVNIATLRLADGGRP